MAAWKLVNTGFVRLLVLLFPAKAGLTSSKGVFFQNEPFFGKTSSGNMYYFPNLSGSKQNAACFGKKAKIYWNYFQT
ncbi:MAG: hypothetical protein E7307_00255 [Butyrivibrio sp.]|nr:hypothetical protein [Butyrivibrio sp.]